jgi:hypothetical protein
MNTAVPSISYVCEDITAKVIKSSSVGMVGTVGAIRPTQTLFLSSIRIGSTRSAGEVDQSDDSISIIPAPKFLFIYIFVTSSVSSSENVAPNDKANG